MKYRRAPLVGALSAAVIGSGVAVLSGCAPAAETNPHFALTSAEIIFDVRDGYPVNLVFVADTDDPIWNTLEGIAIPNGRSYAPGEFELHRGQRDGETQLGNVTFSYEGADGAADFSQVELYLGNGQTPVVVDVGDWSLKPEALDDALTPAASVPDDVMHRCGPYETTFRARESLATRDAEIVIGTAGMEVRGVTVSNGSADPREVSARATLDCSDEYDFYVASPRLVARDSAGTKVTLQAYPTAVGFQAIDDDTVAHIRAR